MKAGKYLDRVREIRPLVHFITNYVTVNDCANVTLAVGASPIMADDPAEVAEVTRLCRGLVLNMGTLDTRTVESMLAAGREAKSLGHAVVFDPVGAGVSELRRETARAVLDEVRPDIIKGNMSEITALALGRGSANGVDARPEDCTTAGNIGEHAALARDLARSQGCVVVATGKIDLVTDGEKTYAVANGCQLMESVTGAGCMAGAVVGAFAAAAKESPLEAAAAAMACMGAAGERAKKRLPRGAGSGSFRVLLIDALSCFKGAKLASEARIKRLDAKEK